MQKFLRTLMLVALMLPFASQAQTLTVCDGTVNSQYVPFDGYNADAAQHNQMLYPATDLTAMNGQAITQMVFYIDQSASNGSNTAASRLGTWTVSLGETTATTLSDLDNTTTLTQVYQGYFDCSTGTLTLEFDQAYAYNGGNLLVDLNHAAASWNRWYFLGMTTTADASYNSDDDESYTFLPKCTFSYGAVPTCFKVTNLTATNATTTSLTLTWTDALNTSATYSIYDMSDTSLLMSNVTGTTCVVNNLTAATTYTLGVQTNCGSDNADGFTTVTGTTPCEANTTFPWSEDFESYTANTGYSGSLTYAFNAPCWINEHITGSGTYLFEVSTYNTTGNTTKQLRLPDMSNGTQTKLMLPAMDIPTGSTYQFVIDVFRNATGSSYTSEGVRVYASTTGDITGATELGFLYRNCTQTDGNVVTAETASGWYTYEFTIPFTGTCYIILRGENQYGSATYLDNFIVREAPSCLPVSALTIDATTSSSLTLTWTDAINTSATYSIYDMSDTSLVASNISATTYTVDNLDANTAYEYGVIADCGGGELAEIRTVSGRTACEAATLPWTCGFEADEIQSTTAATALPWCSERYVTPGATSGLTYPYSTASNPHDGSRSLYIYGTTSSSYPETMALILPQVDVTSYPMNGNRVTFWAKMGSASYNKYVYVATLSDPTDINTLTVIDSAEVTGTTYAKYTVSLANATATDAYVVLAVNRGSGTMYIDDLTIEETPACLEVPTATVASVTASSITLSWTENPDNSSATYSIYDLSDSSLVASNISGTTYTVENLDANTDYNFAVQANCPNGDAPLTTVSGRTACAAIASLPYTMGFEADDLQGTTNALLFPWCWTRINTLSSSSTYNYYPYAYNYGTPINGSRHLYFYASSYGTYADTTGFVMPELDVTNYPMNANRVTFWAKVSSSSTTYNIFVGTMTDPTDRSTFAAVDTVTVNTTTATKYSVSLATATATDAYVAFIVPKVNATMYIDDVTLEEMPACLEVVSATVDNVTTNSITLSWVPSTDNPTGTTYSIYDMSDSTLLASNISGTTYTVDGLTPSTNYTLGIQANCAAGDAAFTTATAQTACGVMSMPWSENFDSWAAKSNCWSFLSGQYNGGTGTPTTSSSAWGLFSTYGDYITISGKALAMNLYSSNRYWAVTPAIEITGDAVLSVDMASSAWSAAASNYDDNDSVILAITTDSGATWTTLLALDNTVLNALSGTYTTFTAPVTGYTGETVRFAIYGGSTSGTSPYDNRFVFDNVAVEASNPPAPEVPEATIAASDIIYWVGTGNNQAVVAVNWADTALAWGVNFSTDSISSQAALDSIAAADPRFNYILDGGYLNNITFTEDNTTLSGDTTSYWESKRNSDYDMGLYQMLGNNDFQKWCNNAAGVAIDSTYYDGWGWSYIYNYPMTIYPVSVPAVGPIVECGVMNLPFNESFDSTSATRACWTTIDADGDSLGWTTIYNGADQGMMLSASYDNTLGALTPDNWLISPKIHTVAGNTITLEWDIAAADDDYAAEHYGVYVSTTTTDTSAFTLLNEWTLTSANTTNMVQDLSAYAGQEFYVAFRHFNCTDQFILILDNVNIHEGAYVPDTLTVVLATNDATMGTTNPVPGTYQYITGDTVSFSAVANTGYHFTQWEYTAAGDTTVYTYSNENVSFLASNMMPAGTLTFTANFEADPTCVQAIPYVENFSTDYADYCWTKVNCHANTGLYNGAFRFYYSTTPPQIIISPELTGTQNGIQLAFDYRAHSANYTESFMVGYSTTTNDTSAFTWSPEVTNITNTEYVRYVENVTTSGVKYVAIKYTANDQFYLYIDSLVVRDIPSCPAVTGLTVDSATATSVFLSWTGTANSYTVYNMGDTSVIASNVAGNTYEVTGLTASTDYVFGVAANCGTETSELTTVAARTDCANGGCNITITSTGNYGFLGASIDVMQNGGLVASVNGNGVVYVCSDSPVSLVYNAGGSYDSYVSFTVADGAGIVIYTCTDGSTMTDGAVFTTIATPCPTCMPVSNLTVSNATPTSITIGWTGNATSYDVYNGSTFVANVTTNTYTFNGLTAATSYTFGVQAICSATDSAVMVTVAASTDCDDITTLPYNEGFENGLGCWTSVNGSSDGVDWSAQPAFSNGAIAPHTGTYMASSWSWNSSAMNANAWMISPKFVLPTVTAGDSLTFSWWARTNHTYPDKYSVVLSTSTNDTAAFTTVIRPYAMADTSDTWVLHTVDLTAYAGQSVYIAFHHVDYDMNYLLIDDIALVQGAYVPPAPDSIAVTYTVNNASMGSINPSGTVMTAVGDYMAATATANTGYELYGWQVTLSVGGQTLQDTTFLTSETSANFGAVAQVYADYNASFTITALFQPEVGIEDVDGSNVNIYSTDNKIVVKGAEGEDIYIYDLNGRTIATKANANETMEFTVVSGGVYLVKVGDAPAKRVLVIR